MRKKIKTSSHSRQSEMSTENGFHEVKNGAIKHDNLSNGWHRAVEFSGKVEFDLGEWTYSPQHNPVFIKGEFPRMKPHFTRQNVKSEEVELMKTYQRTWLSTFFDLKSERRYFEEVIDCSSNFNANVYPMRRTDSAEMQLALQMNIYFWILDDQLEIALNRKVEPEVLEEGLQRMLNIFVSNETIFVDIDSFPRYRGLFYMLATIHDNLGKHVTAYQEKSKRLFALIERYFRGVLRPPQCDAQGKRSEEALRNWRKIVSGADTTAECIWLVENAEDLSAEISNSPLLARLCHAFNGVVSFTNDLLGMKHEFGIDGVDNIIVVKAKEGKTPMSDVFKEVCELITDELTEYLMLREALLSKFQRDLALVKYLDVFDGLLDGHNRMYLKCIRYGAQRCIKLID